MGQGALVCLGMTALEDEGISGNVSPCHDRLAGCLQLAANLR